MSRRSALPTEEEKKTRAKIIQNKINGKFIEVCVPQDGLCQFTALDHQQKFYGVERNLSTGSAVELLRERILDELCSNKDEYKDYVGQNYGEYLKYLQGGGWGDNITLQVFANIFGITVHLITSFENDIVIKPMGEDSSDTYYLSFLHEYHYNSLIPAKFADKINETDIIDEVISESKYIRDFNKYIINLCISFRIGNYDKYTRR